MERLVLPPPVKLKRPRRSKYKDQLPRFTAGLEAKLVGLVGEPAALARKFVNKHFDSELSTNEGRGIRYTYHARKSFAYIDLEAGPGPMWMSPTADFMPRRTLYRSFNFRVDLFEDLDGKLYKFSFALEFA